MAIEEKKPFFKNDTKLVCSLLVFYGVCFLGLIGAVFYGLNWRANKISQDATSTAVVVATQHADATATTIVRTTEQAQYKYVDKFDKAGSWSVETSNDEYMIGSRAISHGVYSWDIHEVKKPFYYWANSRRGKNIKDFDVYVDAKVMKGDACPGFLFRKSADDWENGSYLFTVCNNSFFEVYYDKQDEWDALQESKFSEAIRPNDWNRLEISARGSHFVFRINHVVVFEMTDKRLSSGEISLLIDVPETNPSLIWFDNFGLQTP